MPAPALHFFNNFDFEILGSNPPWSAHISSGRGPESFIGSGTIVTGGFDSGGIPGQCVHISATGGILVNLFDLFNNDFSTFFGLNFDLDSTTGGPVVGQIHTISYSDLVTNIITNYGWLLVEPDLSMSFYVIGTPDGSSTLAGNSSTVHLRGNTWNFIQLNVTTGSQVIMGTEYVSFDNIDLVINGEVCFSGIGKPTNVIMGTPNTNGYQLNTFQWNHAAFDGSLIDSIDGFGAPGVPINQYPNPGNPFGRITQSATEIIKQINNAQARVTQMPTEIIKLPSSMLGRITQMPIELIYTGTLIVGEGNDYVHES